MPTKKPRVTFTLDEKRLDKIDKYRFEYKLKNQTQAILSLIEKGLDTLSTDSKVTEPDFSKEDVGWLNKYKNLDHFGKKTVDSVITIELERMQSKSDQPKAEVIELDFSSYKASAGTGFLLLDEDTKKISVYSNPTTRKADICISVSGDSMMPKFHDGDILLVRKQPDVLQGEIGIFLKGNEAFVKKKGADQLLSLNPDYPNIFDDDDNLITCYGKVIHKLEEEWIVK